MGSYKTIFEYGEAEDVINKSKFIGYAMPVETEEEAVAFVEKIKKKHKDATHNVPVYLVGEKFEVQRYSDDGEPSGTAGVPVLSMLKNEGITNIAVVVTRYFGGIKLGTGGLVRAYTHAAKIAVEAARVVEKRVYKEVHVHLDYTLHGKFQNFLMNNEAYLIKDTLYTDSVNTIVYIEPDEIHNFQNKIVDLTNGKVEINEYEDIFLTILDGKAIELE
ncbi:YigZ family protein [Fusibacter sp. JL216-2]|uniref:YigZ family protein n=1 Tax=Fusibacter sp. JL216-2 TaxID=3071453 RepID=UPI003D333134